MAQSSNSKLPGIRIAIDRGGTFCDVWAFIPQHLYHDPSTSILGNAVVIPSSFDLDGVQITFKLLSEDPQAYDDAPSEGIRRVLQIAHGKEIEKNGKLDTGIIGGCHILDLPYAWMPIRRFADSVRMGTTVATNALLVRSLPVWYRYETHAYDCIGTQRREDRSCCYERFCRFARDW